MSTVDLALFLKIALIIWMVALVALIAVQLLRGDINTSGLLQSGAEKKIDPERVAMLLVTVLVMGGYAITVLSGDLTFNEQTGRRQLPDAPDVLLALLAGGNTTYLAGKISRR